MKSAVEGKEAEDSLKWSDFVERRDYTGKAIAMQARNGWVTAGNGW
eukprot:COSAG02_NODE_765_length_17396_cov_16.796786_11_plen_46_part_00